MAQITRILIVDDEFPIRYLVEHALSRNGYEVVTAKDGPSAIKMAAACQPDVIVLDIMMPDMDGYDVCEQLKKQPETTGIPVIFLTALMTQKHKDQAFRAGATDYLVKPFQADELLAHVTSVLRKSSQSADAPAETTGSRPRLVSFFSPKGGVGTTTLAVQVSEALAIHQDQQLTLIDLALPIGSISGMLNLLERRHIVNLLQHSPAEVNRNLIIKYLQTHRRNLSIIPAPGTIETRRLPDSRSLITTLDLLFAMGNQVIMDLGSSLTPLTLTAMRQSDIIFLVTSGEDSANRAVNAFIEAAPDLQIEPNRILPVVNEVFGTVNNERELVRVPTARIPQTDGESRTKLWLREQGMQKLVSLLL
jgi:pilus assembly protein CpaE